MKNLCTTPSFFATIIMVVLIIVAGAIIVSDHPLPDGSLQLGLAILTFIFGVNVENKPLGAK